MLIAFGRLVRLARSRAMMTQRVFGLQVDLDQGSVSRLEHGRLRGIRPYRLAPVLSAMGILESNRKKRDLAALYAESAAADDADAAEAAESTP